MPKDLPHYFIIARLLVEERLSGKMPEQVNVERKAGKLKDGLFNLQAKRGGGFVFSLYQDTLTDETGKQLNMDDHPELKKWLDTTF